MNTLKINADIDYNKETYYVADGMCGFAWINIKPARGKFVKFLKDNNIGRKDSFFSRVLLSDMLEKAKFFSESH